MTARGRRIFWGSASVTILLVLKLILSVKSEQHLFRRFMRHSIERCPPPLGSHQQDGLPVDLALNAGDHHGAAISRSQA